MEPYDPRRDLLALFRAMRRQWTVLLAAVILGALGGLAATFLQTKQYEASATVLVRADPLEKLVGLTDEFAALGDPTLPGSAMQTQLRLVRQRSLADAVKRRLGLEDSVGSLLEKVRGEQDSTSSLLRVVARDDSSADAGRLATAWAEELAADAARGQARRIENGIAVIRAELSRRDAPRVVRASLATQLRRLTALGATADPPLRVIERAVAGGGPVAPRRAVAVSVGVLIGLILGSGIALLRELRVPRPQASAG